VIVSFIFFFFFVFFFFFFFFFCFFFWYCPESCFSQPNPTLLRMTIFAKNDVEAKSKFFYFSSRLKNLKRANGEILACSERFDTSPEVVKNFGIFLRYNSRSGTHNMYKEFRDTTRTGAVAKMFNDMAGRHRARRKSIQIMKVKKKEKKKAVLSVGLQVDRVPAGKTRRAGVKQFHNSKIRFALPHRVARVPRDLRQTFVAARPSTSGKN
jgi:large subunit ribosomal protein L18Ae